MKSRLKEVEKKYRIKHLDKEALVLLLEEAGATLIKRKREVDTYFNVAGRDSLMTKECLRVRESNNKKEITYKPPTYACNADQSHFAKIETNVAVQDTVLAIELLKLIGNEVLVVVEKDRSYYELGECSITLDLITGAGLFAEIEVETNDEKSGIRQIDAAAATIGLDSSMIEMAPYRDLVLKARSRPTTR